jgi:hypothetical protein
MEEIRLFAEGGSLAAIKDVVNQKSIQKLVVAGGKSPSFCFFL